MKEQKKRSFASIMLAICLSIMAALGLTACSGDDGDSNTGGSDATTVESEAFIADMKAGVKIVNDMLVNEPNTTKIMLADDVEQPTQKYGMWVMPYYPSDAVKKFTMTIEVKDGKFVVTCISAATGKTWQMDQDEKMTEVTTG
ncbi:MAG: hypothetical protein LBC29_01950 [Propionibacteriaceae bacterium]|jgi:hypothetical protein|nr:hypothetical protein [Propionibacteriaceae bacterium]